MVGKRFSIDVFGEIVWFVQCPHCGYYDRIHTPKPDKVHFCEECGKPFSEPR